MDNSIDKQTLKKQMESLSWFELMTCQPMIDLYVEHIRESPIPYECKDEAKETEGLVKDFNRILSKRGRAILKDLFSDIHINEPFGDRISEFARRFSLPYKRTGWLYWLQVIVSYTSTLLMWYAFLDKDKSQT